MIEIINIDGSTLIQGKVQNGLFMNHEFSSACLYFFETGISKCVNPTKEGVFNSLKWVGFIKWERCTFNKLGISACIFFNVFLGGVKKDVG